MEMIISRIITIVAIITGFSVKLQSQDVVIHVPVSQSGLLEVDAGGDVVTESPDQILLGEALEVKGGTPAYTYRWTDPDLQDHEGMKLQGNSFGKYILEVTDQRHCTALDSVTIFNALSVDPDQALIHTLFFPNPSSGIIYFDTSIFGKEIQVEIMDVSGRKIFQHQFQHSWDKTMQPLNLDELPGGTYLLRLSDGKISRTGHIQIN